MGKEKDDKSEMSKAISQNYKSLSLSAIELWVSLEFIKFSYFPSI